MRDTDFSRIFAMSAFEGLRVLRLRANSNPELSLSELADLVRRVDADAGTHDYDAAFSLDPLVARQAPAAEALIFYQVCIEAVIPSFRPLWGRIIPLGRRKFVQKLSQDEEQCFRFAGLLDEPPTSEIISWWDRVSGLARLRADQEKMVRAREAELLSLQYETERLRKIGVKNAPLWMSIEDNTAGYDIQSFDLGTDSPVARLIEVKSTIASPLRFYVSRNEWETAKKFGASYFFHVWDLRGPQLHERTVADIEPHIPTDAGRGNWQSVTVIISSNAP